ncbi:MAG TPA: hypothetical protein PLE35_03035, partial [Lentisphaeria bacterium]|nr:hypothetical protein [Lentisphaeria bacterium]
MTDNAPGFNLLDQDNDGVPGEPGEDNYTASFSIAADAAAPYIVGQEPSRPGQGDLTGVRLTFNEWMDEGSFTPADIVLSLPGGGTMPTGDITVTPVPATPGVPLCRVFDVAFPTQTAEGEYLLAVGPAVTDLVGNAMIRWDPYYATGFEAGADANWSKKITFTSDVTTQFLGRYSNDTVTLNLAGLPAHNGLRLVWDLIIMDTWDGSATSNGPDYWGFNVVGLPAPHFEYTF